MHSKSVEQDIKTTTHLKKKSKIHKNRLTASGCRLIVYGNCAIILGLSLIILQSSIMSFIAAKILNLNSDSSVFKMWQKYPIKVPYAMTFFNWTNHEDFFNRSIKPKFEEIGPYTYLQQIERVDIVRNNNNNTITFRQIHTYEYDNNLPNNGNLSDRLITINYFTMLIGHLIEDWHNAAKDIFSEYMSLLNPYHYFETVIDNEIMKGNNNFLLEVGNYLDFIFPGFPRLDGFGWGKIRNGDPNFDGVFNIANGINRQFDLLNWNYNSYTSYFNESCNKVKGSIGDVYSFPLNKEFITIFVTEACRYVVFYFEKEVVVDGILGYKYSFTKLSLDNGTLNAENKCFCDEPCLPSGVIGLSSCRFNLNAFISLPHYYNADPFYVDPFEGIKPEKEKHEVYIVVEPKFEVLKTKNSKLTKTSLPNSRADPTHVLEAYYELQKRIKASLRNSLLCLEFRISAQINLFLHPIDGISFFDNFPKLYFPLFWIKMHGQLPNKLKKYLKLYLNIPYVIIVTAIILITLGIYLTCYGVYKFKQFCILDKSQSIDSNVIKKVPINQ